MSAFPSSSIGLPNSLNYSLPPSASDSCRSYSVNLAPDGITLVSAPAAPTTFLSANALTTFPFNSQVISFSIPSGNSSSVFLDPTHTTLSFSLTYAISTASVQTPTNGSCKLISSAASFFDQLVLYSNNTPLEQVNQYGLLQNFMLQNTVNIADRTGGISVCMGADSNSATGIDISTVAAQAFRYNFSIPLMSMIGINSDKLFPVGMVNNLQLQMTTSTILPIISFCTAVTTQPVFSTQFNLSEFSLNLKYVDIGEQAAQMLMMSIPDNRILYKTATYTNSQVTLPNGSSGAQQLLLQIRNTSVKSVYSQFGIATSLVSPNGLYDAVNITTNSRQLQIGGSFFPNRPLNDVARPSEGYLYLIQALGGSIPKSLGTVVYREMYNSVAGATLPTGANVDSGLTTVAATSRAAVSGSDMVAQSAISYPSGHFHGYDLERLGGVMFSGINTRSVPPFLNLNIQNALSSTVSLNSWGYSDVILAFDIGSKSVQAFV